MKFIVAIAALALVFCAGPKAEEPSVGEQQVNKLMEEAKNAPPAELAKEEAPADSSAEEDPAEE